MNTEATAATDTEDAAQGAAEATTTNDAATSEAPAAAPTPEKTGKFRWYIVHAHSGFEKKVATHILEQAALKGLSDKFEEVVVPTENVVEVRRGKKVEAEKKFFPGYVLAKMEMSDATWQLVKNIDKVTGFLGGKGIRPQPISEAEAQAIFQQAEEGASSSLDTVMFEIGEQVKIIDGPFESFIGSVEDVDEEKKKLKVSVSIFGRSTPVELTYDQVHKVEG
jgi:transcriptional antiterminator NusG